ncbi:MAG: hypothetical protein QOG29_1933 [Gaiellaceae bacterium]|nr:hypothetical protein [Gaiellaceae bacterium]
MRRVSGVFALAAIVACGLGPGMANGQSPATVDPLIATCPSAADVAAISADLDLSFESDPTGGTLVCTAAAGSADLTRAKERAFQALRVMRQLQFTRPLPWTSLSLYAWLNHAIDGIRFRGDISTSFCCDPPRVINVQLQNLSALSTVRWADPQFGSGLSGLVGVITHEARHSEGPVHTCGPNDATYREGGAWAIQHDLFLWLALYTGSFLDAPGPELSYYRLQALFGAEQALGRVCTLPSSDLSITVVDTPDPVAPGGQLTYTATVANAGPAPAENVALAVEVPRLLATAAGGAVATGATAGQGTCTVPSGGKGDVGCALGTLATGASTTVTVTFAVDAPSGLLSNNLVNLFSLAARVTSTSTDSTPGNNLAAVSTTVALPPVPTCLGRPVGRATLIGTPGNDRLVGGPGAERICGLGGNDTILGGGGNDLLSGGDGNDKITGGPGKDLLNGEAGNDVLLARDGRPDRVVGGPGTDTATVDRGRDSVSGVERRR